MTLMHEDSLYEEYIARSRYARYNPAEGRRESWHETVDRLMSFWSQRYPSLPLDAVKTAILNKEVMPSMRTLMSAGVALERNNIAGYNCAYLTISEPMAFDELMYICMNGTGPGFSEERKYVEKLPVVGSVGFVDSPVFPGVSEEDTSILDTTGTIRVKDSKEGWASALRCLITRLYQGKVARWDLSEIRPAGHPLKIFGGRSSGPAPLDELFAFTCETFAKAKNKKLSSLDVHDICCYIAHTVVVGGVRRTACIALSDLDDEAMRKAKAGAWFNDHPYRSLANNSAVYTEKPSVGSFMSEWLSLYESKSGERGIFNRQAATDIATKVGRPSNIEYGCNPCSEVILQPKSFCNLSEVVVRSSDDLVELRRKVKIATLLGTLQATLTDFKYLSPTWKKNAEEERLLGVSLTGIMDHRVLSKTCNTTREYLSVLKKVAHDENKLVANKLGINAAKAITTVKPSGTVSQLVNCSSGIHPRYAEYYIRRVRGDLKDPLTVAMCKKFDYEIDVYNTSSAVFSFPIKAPTGAVLGKNITAIKALEHWLLFQEEWCDHKPSITVTVEEDEWLEVGAWVYKNFDVVSGVSFLPSCGNHSYVQAPYEAISKATYYAMKDVMPTSFAWDSVDEHTDLTSAQLISCTGGNCDNIL